MHGKHIIVGITGGIAAYKAADLVRRLVERGAEVQVVMTAGATRFITPLTLQALSGRPVRDDLWDVDAEAAMGHIELARWADRVVVAPASADFLARLAHGNADDLLTTLCLATEAPVAVAPAMNRVMFANAATQANLATLRARGVEVLGPADGSQACGEFGPGRMLEAAQLLDALGIEAGPLTGRRALVTAGPTHEAIDPVRYLGNRSSGKMGYALAAALRAAGAEVTLVSGPTALATPAGVSRVDVESAADMLAAVERAVAGVDLFVAVAAVADWTPARTAPDKLKKAAGVPTLELSESPDVLGAVTTRKQRPFTVGFAAETGHLREHARDKLEGKRLDMVVANPVGDGRGFGRDDNELLVLWPGGELELPRATKLELARRLAALIAERMAAR